MGSTSRSSADDTVFGSCGNFRGFDLLKNAGHRERSIRSHLGPDFSISLFTINHEMENTCAAMTLCSCAQIAQDKWPGQAHDAVSKVSPSSFQLYQAFFSEGKQNNNNKK